jgi:hypothetical protein
MVRKVKKVIKGLEKASNTHKKQAETLKTHASKKSPPGTEAELGATTTNSNLELDCRGILFGTEAITTNADTHTTTIADGSY